MSRADTIAPPWAANAASLFAALGDETRLALLVRRIGALPDVPGILMGICGVGASALGVVKPTEGAIIVGLGALTGFVLWAARVNAPALDRSAPSSGAAPVSAPAYRTIRWRRL
jgi:hypothetical protein